MSFFKPKKNSSGGLTEITEADLPISVRQKLSEIAELRETIENLEPSDGGSGDIDLGTF